MTKMISVIFYFNNSSIDLSAALLNSIFVTKFDTY